MANNVLLPWSPAFAAAALCVAASQAAGGYDCLVTALAPAEPRHAPTLVCGATCYGQESEDLASEVDDPVFPASLLLPSGYCINVAPAEIQSGSHGLLTDANGIAPLGKCFSFAVVGNESIASPVVLLLFWSCPADVPRLVISVMVREPVESVTPRRRPTNIGKELLERIPLRTDGYSATTVEVKHFVIGIKASAAHRGPTDVCPTFASAGKFGVSVFSYDLPVEASARLVHAGPQGSCKGNRLVAAVAFAQPGNLFAAMRALFDNDKTPESLIC